jgi:hypothetical protein
MGRAAPGGGALGVREVRPDLCRHGSPARRLPGNGLIRRSLSVGLWRPDPPGIPLRQARHRERFPRRRGKWCRARGRPWGLSRSNSASQEPSTDEPEPLTDGPLPQLPARNESPAFRAPCFGGTGTLVAGAPEPRRASYPARDAARGPLREDPVLHFCRPRGDDLQARRGPDQGHLVRGMGHPATLEGPKLAYRRRGRRLDAAAPLRNPSGRVRKTYPETAALFLDRLPRPKEDPGIPS